MKFRTFLLSLSLLTAPLRGFAADLSVVVDIPPVHALVSRVMAGAGSPDLLIGTGASPHHHALRPSQARALEGAGVVVWVGPRLTPGLETPLTTLAARARIVTLFQQDAAYALHLREGAEFGGNHEDEHQDHGHSDEGADPHAWLSPEVAKTWTDTVAAALATVDPGSADLYLANAEAARAEIDKAVLSAQEALQPVQDAPFMVDHDAFQYFEHAFGLHAIGAVSDAEAVPPGPARMRAVRDRIAQSGIVCIVAEPGGNLKRLDTVTAGRQVRTVVIDPLGAAHFDAGGSYPDFISDMASRLAECLSGP